MKESAWRVSNGTYLGLDYCQAQIVWQLLNIKVSPKTFEKVMIFANKIAASRNENNRDN